MNNKMIIDVPYYEDNTRLSNTTIGIFLTNGAKRFKDYLNGLVEKLSGAFIDFGEMVHTWLLENSIFWENYEILDFDIPKSKQMQNFIESWCEYNTILDSDKRILLAYRKAYANKKIDSQVIEEGKTILETYNDYSIYLENKSNKKIISWADHTNIKKIEANIKLHKKANELLFNLPDTFETFNEFHINWIYPKQYENIEIKCKSLIDRLAIDHKNKKIILIDLKTTSKLFNFKESMETFNYHRQLAFYLLAIHWYFKNILEVNIEDYLIETYIIAIENHDSFGIRVFSINPDKIEEQLGIIDKVVQDICWHTANDSWDYNKEYYLTDGSEKL